MNINFRLLVLVLTCSLAGPLHAAVDAPESETAVCKPERQKIWKAESTETREMAVGSYKECLSNKAPFLMCRSDNAWCSELGAENVTECPLYEYPETIIFDLRTNQTQLQLGLNYPGNTYGQITNFEVTGFTDIYHFRTEYFRGVSVVGFSRDMSVVTDYTSTLNTEDGFPRILGGDRHSCTRYATEKLKEEDSGRSEAHLFESTVTTNLAHDRLLTSAKEGDAEAQFQLAMRFYEGVDVEQDGYQALFLLRKSAAGGFVAANYSIGFLYEFGEGIEQDLERAIRWYRIAADMGFGPAQSRLGDFYFFGESGQIERNFEKAFYWYTLGAKQNDPEALLGLGLMHSEGHFVEQDADVATSYFEKAAEVGSLDAQTILGNQYYDEEKFHLAAKYLELASAQGDPYAQYNLANLYEVGAGVDKDFVKMTKLFGYAAVQGYAEAQHAYALSHLSGLGVKQNYSLAYKWQRLAAEQGLLDAQFALANMYLKGQGTEQNLSSASKWFLAASEQGDTRSQINLARLLHEGVGIKQNNIHALMWASIAAQNGNAAALSLRDKIDKSMTFYDVRQTEKLIEQCLSNNLVGC